jgi:hypothetical protein
VVVVETPPAVAGEQAPVVAVVLAVRPVLGTRPAVREGTAPPAQ